jgi:hypothetical protein
MSEPRTKTKPPTPVLAHPRKNKIDWVQTEDAVERWRSRVGRDTWVVRVNDFPEEHMYTLLINGRASESFDEWPADWTVSGQDSTKSASRISLTRSR